MLRPYQRPENALKRATEFIGVNKPNRALEVLCEVIKRNKTRTNYSEKLLEPIMIKYLELCVDLKKSHLAKEGLFQYRNIFQSVNISSLEYVVRYYLQLAEQKTESARKESHQAVVNIDDLDNLATPEEILLSAVSGDDAQDRSDRTILTPWVKFLWESYRQCLELLRTNSRVERLYHDIAEQAFKFCEKYSRKTEFRKLCDNLRTHLMHIQKQQGSATAINLNNPETQQMNLETRLEQLNYAIKMELWQEAYKAIEDISDLMTKSKKMPKPPVMASYYNKLSLVFWKAGNLLFHSAALFKLFQLLRDQKKNITVEELGKSASLVLVATLAIPLPSAHPEFDRIIETEKSSVEKIEKLATLLSLPKAPTRASLIKDLVRFNVVSAVPQNLQNMYSLMELEFDPLHLCNRMQEHFTWINEHSDLGLVKYISPLQEMTITRLVKQISQLYQTITFSRLLELSVFLAPFHLERVLVDLARHNDLQIRIDHRKGCVHFGGDLSESQREDLPEGPTLQPLPSETIRCQLVQMNTALHQCLALIMPENRKKAVEPDRVKSVQLYEQTKLREHHMVLQRQHIIEERKEMQENQNFEREESLRRAQELQLKKQKDEEQERLKREAIKREKLRQQEQLKQIHTKQIKDKLLQISQSSYGQKMMEKFDEEELLNLDAEEIFQRQVEELEKERREFQQKLKAQEKKVDYFERAKRLLEIPYMTKYFEEQQQKDEEFWNSQEEERVKKLISEHQVSLSTSQRLTRMLPDKEAFIDKLTSTRKFEIDKKLNDFNARLEVERKNRLAERKEQRRKERREAYLKKKEEEEMRKKDEEMKREREERERAYAEAQMQEEKRYNQHKAELDRQAECQREKERIVEERMRESQREILGGEKPPLWTRGAGLWREKEKAKMDSWRSRDSNESVDKDDLPKHDNKDADFISNEKRDVNASDTVDSEPPKEKYSLRRGDKEEGDRYRGDEKEGEPYNEENRRDYRDGSFERREDADGRYGLDKDFRRSGESYRKIVERGVGPLMFKRGGDRRDPRHGGAGEGREVVFRRGGEVKELRRGDDNVEFKRGGGRDLGPDVDNDRDYKPGDGDRDFGHGDDGRVGSGRSGRGGGATRDRDYVHGSEGRDRDYTHGGEGKDRDYPRGGEGRDRDYPRGGEGRDRDYPRGGEGRDRDYPRGGEGKDRDYPRGGEGRDRDYPRGGEGRDRDYPRGGEGRDRDYARGGDRDFGRDGVSERRFNRGGDRDIRHDMSSRNESDLKREKKIVFCRTAQSDDSTPSRDSDNRREDSRTPGRGPPFSRDREERRPDDRKYFRDDDRRSGPPSDGRRFGKRDEKGEEGGSYRHADEGPTRIDEPRRRAPREETDKDGWTKVNR